MNNKIEIPEFLIEMSKRLNKQDNRMTSDPLFEVRYKQSLITEQGYNESHFEIVNDDGETLYHSTNSDDFYELAEYLYEYENEWCKSWIDDRDLFDDVYPVKDINNFNLIFNDYFNEYLDDLPDSLRKFHMQEIEVTVCSHFTEAAAQAFIDRKQHDYNKLYIYAISLYFCEEMKQLRNWILELTNDK